MLCVDSCYNPDVNGLVFRCTETHSKTEQGHKNGTFFYENCHYSICRWVLRLLCEDEWHNQNGVRVYHFLQILWWD